MKYGKVENGIITDRYTFGKAFRWLGLDAAPWLEAGRETEYRNYERFDPPAGLLVALNYLPFVEPTITVYQRVNYAEENIGATEITYGITDFTQEEIDVEIALLAKIAKQEEAAQLILDQNFANLTINQLEAAIAGESAMTKKLYRIVWALAILRD